MCSSDLSNTTSTGLGFTFTARGRTSINLLCPLSRLTPLSFLVAMAPRRSSFTRTSAVTIRRQIILPANHQDLQTIKEILDSYARATGLKINYAKYQLMPINVNAQKTLDLANALGCQVGEMSFTYLGLPLGTTIPTVREIGRASCRERV